MFIRNTKIHPKKVTTTAVLRSMTTFIFNYPVSFGLAWSTDGTYWHETGKPETAKFFSYDKTKTSKSVQRNLFIGYLGVGFCIHRKDEQS